MNQILLLDEASDSSEKLRQILEKDGHLVTCADNARKALAALKGGEVFRLLIAHLPDQKFDAIYKILDKLSEARSRMPVLILVPSPTVPKIILTLERGASDIMNTPYHPKVLQAKVRALIRSVYREYGSPIQSGSIAVQPDKFRILVGKKEIRPTAAQFKLIMLFIQNPERVFSRSELMTAISQEPDEKSRTIDTQIVLLRKLLGPEGSRIRTIRGKGYVFHSPAGASA